MRAGKSTPSNPKVREALAQVETERFQCLTCSGVAQEHSDYCVSCEMRWDHFRSLGADVEVSNYLGMTCVSVTGKILVRR